MVLDRKRPALHWRYLQAKQCIGPGGVDQCKSGYGSKAEQGMDEALVGPLRNRAGERETGRRAARFKTAIHQI